MKGHLDVKELEKYKKADLQKLAEELGVSTEGTIKELAERCAEVEVEVTAMYLDRVLNEVKEPGEVFTVSRERAAILERAKVAKIKE